MLKQYYRYETIIRKIFDKKNSTILLFWRRALIVISNEDKEYSEVEVKK